MNEGRLSSCKSPAFQRTQEQEQEQEQKQKQEQIFKSKNLSKLRISFLLKENLSNKRLTKTISQS